MRKTKCNSRTDLSKTEEMTTRWIALVTGDESEIEAESSVKMPRPHWVQHEELSGSRRKTNEVCQELTPESTAFSFAVLRTAIKVWR